LPHKILDSYFLSAEMRWVIGGDMKNHFLIHDNSVSSLL
jgi:hypothetical protein